MKRPDLRQLADFAEVVAAIGVVVSLLYVATELHQNTRAMHAETFQNMAAMTAQLRSDLVNDPSFTATLIKATADPASLTAVEASRVDAWFAAVLRQFENLLSAGYSWSRGVDFDQQLETRLESLPGVESATLADWVPLSFQSHTSVIELDGYTPQPHESMEVQRAYAGPDYFRTMRIPLVEGRDLASSDDRHADAVAVVNEALAQRYWPGQRPRDLVQISAAD